jgi:hypothetical protein
MVAFWDAYDARGRERSSRSQVLAEWNALRPNAATVGEIMAGVAAWSESETWRDGFAVGAHRFLKLGKWRERPAPPKEETWEASRRSGGAAPLPSRETLRDQLRRDAEKMKNGTARGGR